MLSIGEDPGKMKPNYRLILSPRSPFARRVRLALARLEVTFELEVVDPMNPTEALLAKNPLGLVPILEGGGLDPLIDSPVILDFLDHAHGTIWPAAFLARAAAYSASALAAGAMTAAVALVHERHREAPDMGWIEDHTGAIRRALAELGARCARVGLFIDSGQVTQAGWDLGVLLEYLDLRCPQIDWRGICPNFLPLLEECRKHAYFRESSPPPPVA